MKSQETLAEENIASDLDCLEIKTQPEETSVKTEAEENDSSASLEKEIETEKSEIKE